jgi:signal transduction histidine kinase
MKRLQQSQTRRGPKAARRHVPAGSELKEELIEIVRHRAAISEVLRAIARSPHELQPIFETILANATRLCRANIGSLRLREDKGFRLVARIAHPNALLERSTPTLVDCDFLPRRVVDGSPVHIPDLAQDPDRYRAPAVIAAVAVGIRTFLLVPMLKDAEVIGAISIGRVRVQPFTDKEIELITDFATQAAIALETTRRERQYREVQSELAHANRVATMGQLTASIAHELKQPLAAAIIGGDTGLRWLTKHPPDIDEVRQCLECIIKDVNRATDIMSRVHGLVKKDAARTDTLDINDAILEVITLMHGELVKNRVAVQSQLATELPRIQGDRVQLQQVMLNLIINAVQAMSGLAEGARELRIGTETTENEGVRVAVRDSGPGLTTENLQRLFEPFYTTKPNGMGMGLSICRSIIEAHGGRLWASPNLPHGTTFQFTVPLIAARKINQRPPLSIGGS